MKPNVTRLPAAACSPGRLTLTGTITRRSTAASPHASANSLKRAGADRQHDVVERHGAALLERQQAGERDRVGHDRTRRTNVNVQVRHRRWVERALRDSLA